MAGEKKLGIGELVNIIRDICPEDMQAEWDNTGIQILTSKGNVNRILVALEMTEDLLKEAVEENADFIITHHPLLFNGIKKISSDNPTGRIISGLIKNDIGLYASHTSFDVLKGGNNDFFGEKMGFNNVKAVECDGGYCRYAELDKPLKLADLAKLFCEKMKVDRQFISLIGNPDKIIKKIGWCTGAGASFIDLAIEKCFDLYITGDIKYHDAQHALQSDLCLIDGGHYGTEKIFPENMVKKLKKQLEFHGFKHIIVLETKKVQNPFLSVDDL